MLHKLSTIFVLISIQCVILFIVFLYNYYIVFAARKRFTNLRLSEVVRTEVINSCKEHGLSVPDICLINEIIVDRHFIVKDSYESNKNWRHIKDHE